MDASWSAEGIPHAGATPLSPARKHIEHSRAFRPHESAVLSRTCGWMDLDVFAKSKMVKCCSFRWKREKRSRRLGELYAVSGSRDHRIEKNVQLLFLLLWGEGQDEGESDSLKCQVMMSGCDVPVSPSGSFRLDSDPQ
jgi:hypothetical protein